MNICIYLFEMVRLWLDLVSGYMNMIIFLRCYIEEVFLVIYGNFWCLFVFIVMIVVSDEFGVNFFYCYVVICVFVYVFNDYCWYLV